MDGIAAEDADPEAPVPLRSRGRPARIDRDQIIDAASRFAGDQLTMQAVADELGVSRKTLHYHVGDRQGLLTLVVLAQFEKHLSGIRLPVGGDWRAVVRAYTFAYRDGLVQVGETVVQAPFHGVGASAVLALGDRVLDALLTAGFPPVDARRALTALANLARSGAEDILQTSVRDFYRAQTRAALQRCADTEYPALRRVSTTAPLVDDGQFEFELNLAIVGLERLLVAPVGGTAEAPDPDTA